MNDIGRLAKENEAALFVERHSAAVYRTALAVTRRREDAEDVMQEVFLTCFKKPRIFSSELHERRWLLKVTVNACKDLFAKRASRPETPFGDECDTLPAPDVYYSDGSVTEALMTLPEAERACLHLFYYEGLPVARVAGVLGMKIPTVKSHLKRGRDRLKLLLSDGEISDANLR